jgi:hypothetical protein
MVAGYPTSNIGEDRAVAPIDTFPPTHEHPHTALTPITDQLLTADDGLLELAIACVEDKVTVKSVPETHEVLRLWQQNHPPTTIADRANVHRDTVKNIIKYAEKELAGAELLRA